MGFLQGGPSWLAPSAPPSTYTVVPGISILIINCPSQRLSDIYSSWLPIVKPELFEWKMNVRASGTRPANRRRLSIVNDHQTQSALTPHRIQSYLSLVASHGPLPEPKRSNDGGTKPANGAYFLASSNTSAGKDSLSRVEKEPSKCCYGMVRRE